MHKARLGALLFAAMLSGACVRHHRDHVAGGVLGRVVIYRNGVAFYERHATVVDGRVSVMVPRDRVDDFLKSLTVVDAVTRKPIAVTIPRKEAADGSYLTMTLETAQPTKSQVLLTYVTEAPAWKPSYRVVVGNGGKVMLEGWAVVDNTTSEDWKGVLVGVGASSALAFRYDLWSVRQIDRDLLADEERFASAPPTGVSPYTESAGAEELATLDSSQVRGDANGVSFSGSSKVENQYVVDGVNTTSTTDKAATTGAISGTIIDRASGEKLAGVTVVASAPNHAPQTAITDEDGRYEITNLPPATYQVTFYYMELTVERPGVAVSKGRTAGISQKLDTRAVAGETIQITSKAPIVDQSTDGQKVTLDRNYQGNIPGRTFRATMKSVPGSQSTYEAPKAPPPIQLGDEKLKAIAGKVVKDKRDVVVEVHARPGQEAEAQKRGTAVKNKLVNDGVPASRVHVVPKIGPDEVDDIRVLAVAPGAKPDATQPKPRGPTSDAPVGESHFMADRPMTVRAGTSAMVAMVRGETTGGVVYLYDPISDRGDQRFAFKAVRLDNPTSDTLEAGPVTVYGDGRFIGEGITEPVPPKAAVVVPFALDRQILISKNTAEADRIAKLVTIQRGMITAQLQHRSTTRFTVTSRLAVPTVVYLRHRLVPDATIVEAPSRHLMVGDSQLFAVPLAAGETKYVTIAQATPVERTFELASPEALGMMKVYIDEPEATPALKAQIAALLATHQHAADLEDKIATLREQLGEYRSRALDLEGQLVALRRVRGSADLAHGLRAKLSEMSDRLQKTTLAIVDAREKIMLARVKFQNQLADLKLVDARATVSTTR